MRVKVFQINPLNCTYPIYQVSYNKACRILEPYNLTIEKNWKEIGYEKVFDGEWNGVNCVADTFLITRKFSELPDGHIGSPSDLGTIIYVYPYNETMPPIQEPDESGCWYYLDEDGSRKINMEIEADD